MGMIYNNVTLVYDFDENLEKIRAKAIEIFDPVVKKHYEKLKTDGEFITEIFVTPTNGETYFMIHSCGSKLGWTNDVDFGNARSEFVRYCEDMDVLQLATIEFGENDRPVLSDCLPGY